MTSLAELAALLEIMAANASIVVGIDGPGGSGKSTFAAALSAAWPNSQLVHTDDFASWDEPLNWWPRMLEKVLIPLTEGMATRYQRYDWVERRLTDWLEVKPGRVIIEGVSSCRQEFDAYLQYRIWIDTPPEERLRRGLLRDGIAMEGQWQAWMSAEQCHYTQDKARDRADLVLSGDDGLLFVRT